jgi:hypothetical protein
MTNKIEYKIKLQNVRLSFESLFKAKPFEEGAPKYSATFLLPKSDKKTKATIDKVVAQAVADAKIKVSADKMFIQDGDEVFEEKGYDGYKDHWALRSSNTEKFRPTVVNRDLSPLTEDDNVIYSGCYVNATITLWVLNHKTYGKRVCANIKAVQFVKDGESFAGGRVDIDEEFQTLDDDQSSDEL